MFCLFLTILKEFSIFLKQSIDLLTQYQIFIFYF